MAVLLKKRKLAREQGLSNKRRRVAQLEEVLEDTQNDFIETEASLLRVFSMKIEIYRLIA